MGHIEKQYQTIPHVMLIEIADIRIHNSMCSREKKATYRKLKPRKKFCRADVY